jgi:protocatechuate 3,4-dioxygenase beta subunit
MLDVWQANHLGRYDNDDPNTPPKKGVYRYRARMNSDEQGYYEFETIHPGRYQLGRNVWRPAHIHFQVSVRGYETLTTQLYFKGDPFNAKDRFIHRSLIIDLQKRRAGRGHYEFGVFHIVLAKA